jgi:hypothetical protein
MLVCVALAAAVLACAGVASARSARVHARAASTPTVQAMVVGEGGRILMGARNVSAAATSVRVGSRSCSVAASTPLAVLADLQHEGGPSFALRDYGHCGASARSASELFVYQLGGETNSGQNGWEYKVGNASGTTGAGSTSGASGNGRLLSSGERVLWFWCASRGGGCERTLEVSAAGSVSRGGRLSVRVTGYENEGRGAPVAGAIVTLGSDFASTSAKGVATLLAPASTGRYELSARKSGLVPSFPETIQVR